MNLLIPGGAGYIGSHMVRYAQERGHNVVVLDDLSTGHESSINGCELIKVNLLDEDALCKSLKGRTFDGVIHFAAKSLVGESIKSPDIYYTNNVIGTINLINNMLANGINNLVFSSSAAIFGNPTTSKISEEHPTNPINPYGNSKLMVEEILKDYCSSFNMNATCFRYFNAAGADSSGLIGEDHEPETHLIPNVFKSILSKQNKLKVYGNDYPTKDGTCVRDYVHVNDLAQAHLLGLSKMNESIGFSSYNLGNGNGFSILEIIQGCQEVSGQNIDYEFDSRRDGDPAVLVAESNKAILDLNWKPEFNEINGILESAWNWHKNN